MTLQSRGHVDPGKTPKVYPRIKLLMSENMGEFLQLTAHFRTTSGRGGLEMNSRAEFHGNYPRGFDVHSLPPST